jgi:hypothetical protein
MVSMSFQRGHSLMSDSHDTPQSPASTVDDNYAAWEAGLARIEARLKREHPELFDESGELNTVEVMRILRQHAGGKTVFSGTEFLELFGGPGRAPL